MRLTPAVAGLVCAFGLLQSAAAQEACVEPPAPAPVDGAQASEDQMRAAVAAARNFIAQSDVYQTCLVNVLAAAKTGASATSKPPDPALESDIHAKVDANQKVKEKVGAQINAAIGVYKKTHLK